MLCNCSLVPNILLIPTVTPTLLSTHFSVLPFLSSPRHSYSAFCVNGPLSTLAWITVSPPNWPKHFLVHPGPLLRCSKNTSDHVTNLFKTSTGLSHFDESQILLAVSKTLLQLALCGLSSITYCFPFPHSMPAPLAFLWSLKPSKHMPSLGLVPHGPSS